MSPNGSRMPSRASCCSAPPRGRVWGPPRGRDEHGPLEPFGVEVGELADDGAAHRVADERHLLDATVLEERGCRLGELGHVERLTRPTAAPEAGEVGHERPELAGEQLG